VHLSDLHFQLDWRGRSLWSSGLQGLLGRVELHAMGRFNRFRHVAAQIEQALEDAYAMSADHVVVTGDLTAMGHDEELEAVHRLLAPLLESGRITVIPGNHDRYLSEPSSHGFERFFESALGSALPEYALPSGYPFVRFLGPDVALVGLDTTRVRGLSHYFFGRVGAEQLAALRRLLDDRRMKGRTVVLLSHHGAVGVGGSRQRRHTELLDGAALEELMRDRPAIMLHGHHHLRAWNRASDGRPHSICGGSSTERGGEGYWAIDLDNHADLEARHFGFGRVPRTDPTCPSSFRERA
jgi:3',5'-cyclic AMP phosphodiesterase CpdA